MLLTLMLLSLLPAAAPAAAGGTGGGVVVVATNASLLVETGRGTDVVALGDGAPLVGAAKLGEIGAGEQVRYAWTATKAGVKLADELAVLPVPAVDPARRIAPDEAFRLLREGAVALDARPSSRYEASHLPGAVTAAPDRAAAALAKLGARKDAALLVYGASARDAAAAKLLRRAIVAGFEKARLVEGGVARWVEEALPLAASPRAIARSLAGSGPRPAVVDVRPAAEAARSSVPGAVSAPVASMRPQDFTIDGWSRQIVLVGADLQDRAPLEAAESIRRWRPQNDTRWPLELVLLEGGVAAWRAATLAVAPGASTRPELRADAVPGEIPADAFAAAWAAGGDGAVLLDVRPLSIASAPFATRVPLEELADRVGSLPRDREIVAFCSMGIRSRIAYRVLELNGFKVRFLRGRPPAP